MSNLKCTQTFTGLLSRDSDENKDFTLHAGDKLTGSTSTSLLGPLATPLPDPNVLLMCNAMKESVNHALKPISTQL